MRIVPLVAGIAVLLTGCADDGKADTQASVTVAVSHYPVQYLVQRIAGDRAAVEELASPGTEPHDVELSPQQVGQVQTADAVFYIAGFQPAVDDAVGEAQGTVVDLSHGLALREQDGVPDPHVWLDPTLMEQMATTVADTLAAADPQHAVDYRDNAAALEGELQDLDAAWRKRTADCATRTLVVSHEAFGYLADRYGFVQKGITGLTPDTEPSAAAIADLAAFVRDNAVTTVYTESLVDPAVAQTVADEAGATTATLDPLETQPAGDYISAMRENLGTVVRGQSCS